VLAIETRGLRKRYGGFEALAGVDLSVEAGEVFCFLGPNGAGKTTTVEILEGYRSRSSGQVSVLGFDPATGGREFRRRIGIMLQESGLQPQLTVTEALEVYRRYYDRPRGVGELLDLVGLAASAHVRVEDLSGGQRRRLDLALALAGDPDLVFLDEPTTGFDPAARREAWSTISGLRALGKTIFLTTHYMDEAQSLADRVAVISRGRIVAEGSPDRIGGRDTTMAEVRFLLPEGVTGADISDVVNLAYGADATMTVDGEVVTVRTTRPDLLLHVITGWSLPRGLELKGLTVSRASLEDVYLELTAGDAQAYERGWSRRAESSTTSRTRGDA
jgi:ABC-2 type transport system ATP-binding protein